MLKQFGKGYLQGLRKLKIKSSSISYALFAVVVIGTIVLALVILVSYNNILFFKYEEENNLIANAKSTVNYSLRNYTDLSVDFKEFDDLVEGSIVRKKKWGVLDLIQYKVFKGKDTIKETLFIGKKIKDSTSLTLIGNQKHFSLGGNSIIEGDIKVPFKTINSLNISNTFVNQVKHKGRLKESVKKLPKVKSFFLSKELNDSDIESFNDNSFFEKTKIIIASSNILENITLKGNYILESKSELLIKKSAKLSDIIIKGSSVKIEEGFEGNVQIYASKKVIIEKKVRLKYPSVIYVSGRNDTEIEIGENSQVMGAIIITASDESAKSKISVLKNAVIYGDLYCNGIAEFEGKMAGAIYCNEFYLNTGEAEYKNALLNFELYKLPYFFQRINVFSENENLCRIIKRKK